MADTNKPSSPQSGTVKPQGSGSDTLSAANLAGGTTGSAGQPRPGSTQSGTLASHTSSPMGGGAGSVGQGAGPEHLRHQDKDAGKGMGSNPYARSTGSGSGSSAGGSAGDMYDNVAERAGQAYDQAAGAARDAYRQASSYASDAYDQGSRYYDDAAQRSLEGFGQARRGVERFVAENPVMVGVIGLAAGLLIGALLPRTRPEDRTLGRWADEVRDQGMRYARDMAQRGREFVDETFNDDDEAESRQRPRGPGGQHSQGRYQNH